MYDDKKFRPPGLLLLELLGPVHHPHTLKQREHIQSKQDEIGVGMFEI
jgi:hypothetical protein